MPESRAIIRWLAALEALAFAALIATVLAVEDSLTKETLSIGPEGAGSSYFAYSYDDRTGGGASTSTIGSSLLP